MQKLLKRRQKQRFNPIKLIIFLLIITIILVTGLFVASYWNLLPKRAYTAEHFGIETVISGNDEDGDGLDDLTDIMLGAREYVQTKPRYDGSYFAGGYPPDDRGVCTDVIWKAFKAAGYDLKSMVDEDISQNTEAYTAITTPDPNIDFRRVRNLRVFFKRHAQSLTTDTNDIAAWQPGDIVIYDGHIAIVSDKRNSRGLPYIIHNGGQPRMEEDALTRKPPIEHYRWIQ